MYTRLQSPDGSRSCKFCAGIFATEQALHSRESNSDSSVSNALAADFGRLQNYGVIEAIFVLVRVSRRPPPFLAEDLPDCAATLYAR